MSNHTSKKTCLSTKELDRLGYTSNVAKSLAVNIISKHCKFISKEEVAKTLTCIQNEPETWREDPVWGKLAMHFSPVSNEPDFTAYTLRETPGEYAIYGSAFIEDVACRQMDLAMRLPVTAGGALMPDAHGGFGLPIGGVLATEGVVVPYAVGMDIGCRMSLSIFDVNEKYLQRYAYQLERALREYTHFGMEGNVPYKAEHEILDRPEFGYTSLLRNLRGKAARQLGSSGSGNHFVEFGKVELHEGNGFGLPAGNYTGLLTHSGSRGVGAAIAQYFTGVAMDVCRLPKEAKSLAWLDLSSGAGMEYWMSMNLAGDYARACHDCIHGIMTKVLGLHTLVKIENHHNFAWKDNLADGREVVIHRKGATPAHAGEPGIIPGSMNTSGYIVRGKGEARSLYSASHGAGRALSRQQAKNSITVSELKKHLARTGVTLIGGSTEEAPHAYKDIEAVMKAQRTLVDIEGSFTPAIVRMNKE